MPTTSLLGASTFNLISQQLADIGITVKCTDVGDRNCIAEMLAPKYPATFMALEQNPDWQLIQFMISPDCHVQPVPLRRRHRSRADPEDPVRRHGRGQGPNTYVVQQAWFAPFFRVQGSVASDANTSVTMMNTNAYPAIYDFVPKS